MAEAPSTTLCLINFNKGIYDVTGQTTVTNSSVIQRSEQTKFGSYSGYFDKSSHASLSLQLPSAAKTISMWVYVVGSNSSGWYPTLFSSESSQSSGGTYIHIDDGSYSQYPVYRANSSTSSYNTGKYGNTVISRNAWHHITFCYSGNTHYYFLDGVLQTTVTQRYPSDYTKWYVGTLKNSYGLDNGCYFNGYIGEILITSNCMYTSSYTIPTEAYTWQNEVSIPITVSSTSSYGTHYGSIENLTDGNTSTYWWTNSAQRASQFVRFDFSQPVKFNGLTAQTLNNTGDCISSGTVLQVMTDGTTWETVGNFNGNPTCTFSNLNRDNVIAVRIYVVTTSTNWLCVNEITLDYEEMSPISLYTKVNGSWETVSVVAAYKKVNNVWVEQSDISSLFDTGINYVKG